MLLTQITYWSRAFIGRGLCGKYDLLVDVLCNSSSTLLGFELMTSRLWQYISYHRDSHFNHTAMCDGRVVRPSVSGTWTYCHDLEVMSSNPDRVELGVRSASVWVVLEPKIVWEWRKCICCISSIKSPWSKSRKYWKWLEAIPDNLLYCNEALIVLWMQDVIMMKIMWYCQREKVKLVKLVNKF